MKNSLILSSTNINESSGNEVRYLGSLEKSSAMSVGGSSRRSEFFSIPGQTSDTIVIIEDIAFNKNLRWLGVALALVSASLTLGALLLILF